MGSLRDCYYLKKDSAKWSKVTFRYIYDEGKGKVVPVLN
jgi:hypothetical protein